MTRVCALWGNSQRLRWSTARNPVIDEVVVTSDQPEQVNMSISKKIVTLWLATGLLAIGSASSAFAHMRFEDFHRDGDQKFSEQHDFHRDHFDRHGKVIVIVRNGTTKTIHEGTTGTKPSPFGWNITKNTAE
jgi:hypothetical protein